MNCSAEKQSTGSLAPQDPCGKLARMLSQYLPALRQAPAGSTMWVEDELVASDRLGRRRGLECALLGYAKLPADRLT
jgi:hypothetical protein